MEKIERNFLPALIGLAPVVTLLATWSYDPSHSVTVQVIRGYALPVIAVEMLVIIAAVQQGLLRAILSWWRPQRIWIPLAILLGVAFYTAAVAANPAIGLTRTILWVVHLLFGAAVAELALGRLAARTLASWYVGGFAVFLLLTVAFVLTVPDPANYNWTNGFPGASHIRHLGYYTAAVTGLTLGLFLGEDRRAARVRTAAIVTVAIAFILWCGTRGAAAAIVGGLICGLVLLPPLRNFRVLAAFGLAAVLAIALSSAVPAPADNMGLDRAVSASTGGQDTGITTGRIALWRNTFEAWKESPLVGHGEGQMTFVAPYARAAQPHNAPLQFLFSWGLIGVACMIVLAVPLAWRAIGNARRVPGTLGGPLLAVLMLSVYSLFDGPFYHTLPLSIMAACLGLLSRSALDGTKQAGEPA